MKYYIITPAKNEAHNITFTIESIIKQTLRPEKWIIVDDGSTDDTVKIVEKYRKEYDWIELVSVDSKYEKKLYGSKVIKAFNVGYNLIKTNEFDFIVKLDADIMIPDNYFSEIANAFAENDKVGICGGYIVDKGYSLSESYLKSKYVAGALKSVRIKCFNSIGGFEEANGWDGLDQFKALYNNWEVKKLPLQVTHLRPTASDYRSLQFFYNNGVAHYRMGNDLFLTLIRSVIQLKEKPYILASINYFMGYMKALFSKEPKLVDKPLAKFIKKHHYRKLKKAVFKN